MVLITHLDAEVTIMVRVQLYSHALKFSVCGCLESSDGLSVRDQGDSGKLGQVNYCDFQGDTLRSRQSDDVANRKSKMVIPSFKGNNRSRWFAGEIYAPGTNGSQDSGHRKLPWNRNVTCGLP